MAGEENSPTTRPKSGPGSGKHRPWRKGESGNPKGRPKGSPNKSTADAKEFCAELVDNPAYRHALAQRLIAGTAGAVETLVWHYAKGKPVERVESGGPGAFADVSTDELRQRLAAVLGKL